MSVSTISGRPPMKQYSVDATMVGAIGLSDGRKTVSVAGTAEELSSDTPCKQVTIMAETDNMGIVSIGGSTVVAEEGSQRGIPLFSSGSVTLSINNLNKVFIDATVSGDGVTFIYLT